MKDRSWGVSTIYGVDGEHSTPYLTRLMLGRLRLHIFHRGDADPDCHDHPWDFWTFPLTAYVEEVVENIGVGTPVWVRRHQVVQAFRISFRPATHTHRVLGRLDGWWPMVGALDPYGVPRVKPGRIVTVVWLGRSRRPWGFLKARDGRWCWVAWRDYVFNGGKHAPCEPEEVRGK